MTARKKGFITPPFRPENKDYARKHLNNEINAPSLDAVERYVNSGEGGKLWSLDAVEVLLSASAQGLLNQLS